MNQLLVLLLGLVAVTALPQDLNRKSLIDEEQDTNINKLINLYLANLANKENGNTAVLESSDKRDDSNVTRGLGLDARSACPSQWYGYQGFCYGGFNNILKFRAAQNFCRRLNADVASFLNREESDFIVNTFSGMWLWVGASNENLDGWYWSDSGNWMAFSNWAKGEPNNAPPGEHCIVYDGTNTQKWLDVPCSFAFRFVCKKRL